MKRKYISDYKEKRNEDIGNFKLRLTECGNSRPYIALDIEMSFDGCLLMISCQYVDHFKTVSFPKLNFAANKRHRDHPFGFVRHHAFAFSFTLLAIAPNSC